MKRAAVISAILSEPAECQQRFNTVVSDYSEIIRGRLGVPMAHGHVALVSLTVVAEERTVNELAEKMSQINGVNVSTAMTDAGISVE